MSRSKVGLVLLVTLASIAIVTVSIRGEQVVEKSEIVIRQVTPQTVLYTIYRGDYAQMKSEIMIPVKKVSTSN
jgi:nucleoside diphosphate kinase